MMVTFNTDVIARHLGFDDIKQLGTMVGFTDISTPEKKKAFELWCDTDMTKDGLVALVDGDPMDVKLGDTVGWNQHLESASGKIDEFLNTLWNGESNE